MRFSPAILFVVACAEPGRIDLELRAPDGTDLLAVDSIEITLTGEPDGDEVARGEVSGDRLPDLTTVLRHADVDPGRSYVFEIRAAVPDTVCTSGRIAGRSVPFEVESDRSKSSVTAYVACADDFARTEDPMRTARGSFASAWHAGRGVAVLAGGLSTVVIPPNDEDLTGTAIDSVESYEIATGEFGAPGDDLPGTRASAGMAVLNDGRAVIAGGLTSLSDSTFVPLRTVVASGGDSWEPLPDLANDWVETTSLGLTVSLGGSLILDATTDAWIFNPSLE